MKSRIFYFLLVGVLLVLFFIIFYVLNIAGKKYTKGLSQISAPPVESLAVRKVRTVKKITIQQDGEEGCLDVTPDGIVRSYETCGGELTDANRLQNTRNILRLIQNASEIDISLYKKKPAGVFYTLTIETDTGTETIYVPKENGGDGIDDIIELIEGDLPQPTATPGNFVASPTPTLGGVSSTNTPTPPISSTPGPSPTPLPDGAYQIPFRCGFTEGGQKKPYNVSNSICSTEPTPGP